LSPVPPVAFCLFRRPPSSTLLPYTTLFRSIFPRRVQRALRPRHRTGDEGLRTAERAARRRRGRSPRLPRARAPGVAPSVPESGLDRKSTRLNSSHVKISYAVFCLKKKRTLI